METKPIDAEMLEVLEEAIRLMPLDTAIRAKWLTRASALLAKVRGGAA